jgi:predicted ATPase/DNA-binding SARP family transcriptional activator
LRPLLLGLPLVSHLEATLNAQRPAPFAISPPPGYICSGKASGGLKATAGKGMPVKVLHIRLLGDFSLVYGDEPVRTINTARLQSLLAYLVLHRDAPQPRYHVAFQLWPASREAQALTNLRKLFYELRQALPEADYILRADTHTLQWLPDAAFTLDVADFENGVAQAASVQALRDAVALYRGDLLPSCYDDWILPERERLRQAYAEAIERLVALLEDEHDYRAALGCAERLLRLDPLREATYRSLMRLHALSGDGTGVARVYRACSTVLQRELGVEPSAKTRAAYTQGLKVAATQPMAEERPPARRDNLPLQLTRFIGREREIGQVRQLVLARRLVTLTGVGGIGKTRLALAVAQTLLEAFADGVWHVDLGALADPALVVSAVAAVLGVREEGERPLLVRLGEALHARHVLLLLDNCEHLVAAVRLLAETLLSAAPEVRILATSRVALGATGEVTWRVPPLSTPDMSSWATSAWGRDEGGFHDQVSALAQFESVQVFVDRAAAVLPTFAVTHRNAWAVARICQQLDGIPLALELAAARVGVLTAQQIADNLDDALPLLTHGRPTALPRHQTLQATLDWSYALLTSQEQALLRRLAVFAGSFTLEAAESVGAGAELQQAGVLDVLASLADQSLVSVEAAGEATRFRLHETTRQYARARLAEAGEETLVRNRHLDFFCCLAESLEADLDGRLPPGALGRLTQEYSNLRAALQWSTQADGDALLGLRLAAALADFWELRGQLTTERGWLEALLTRSGAALEPSLRAKALRAAGKVAYYQCDFEAARAFFEHSVALDRALDNRPRLADTLGRLGFLFGIQQDYAAAEPCYRESLALYRALDERSGVGRSLSELGYIALRQGDCARARALLEESLTLFRDPEDRYLEARARHFLGHAARLIGDYAEAHAQYNRAAVILAEMNNSWGLFYLLEAFACLAVAEAQWERAARLFGAVERLGATIGAPMAPIERAECERDTAAARAALGEPAFAAAWAAGQALTLEETIAYALA